MFDRGSEGSSSLLSDTPGGVPGCRGHPHTHLPIHAGKFQPPPINWSSSPGSQAAASILEILLLPFVLVPVGISMPGHSLQSVRNICLPCWSPHSILFPMNFFPYQSSDVLIWFYSPQILADAYQTSCSLQTQGYFAILFVHGQSGCLHHPKSMC